MKVFITKYALTHGIQEKEVERSHTPTMVAENRPGSYHQCYHGEGVEWHLTHESAVARANEMVAKKIKSVEKQLAKLRGMKFE
jgi:hypothetical protein